MTIESTLRDQAVQWAVLTGDPRFEDWDAFTAWLEADPAHARAYDAVAGAVADAAEAIGDAPELTEPLVANDNPAPLPRTAPFGRSAWLGGTIAAAVALLAAVWVLRPGGSTTYTTAPGEVEVIALDDGSTVTLAGGSELVLAAGERRQARLERGQAVFDLRFDQGSAFEVAAGEDTLRDIGTVFEVRRLGETTAVAVAEGAVLFNPGRQAITVAPGETLTHRAGKVERGAIPASQIGSWREGRQIFRDASLAEVAAALSGTTGLRFTVSPGAADRRVSGSVLLAPIREDPASVGPLLGVTARREGADWVLEP